MDRIKEYDSTVQSFRKGGTCTRWELNVIEKYTWVRKKIFRVHGVTSQKTLRKERLTMEAVYV
jgi:hypothetical protein